MKPFNQYSLIIDQTLVDVDIPHNGTYTTSFQVQFVGKDSSFLLNSKIVHCSYRIVC